jgi:hypothetical protein
MSSSSVSRPATLDTDTRTDHPPCRSWVFNEAIPGRRRTSRNPAIAVGTSTATSLISAPAVIAAASPFVESRSQRGGRAARCQIHDSSTRVEGRTALPCEPPGPGDFERRPILSGSGSGFFGVRALACAAVIIAAASPGVSPTAVLPVGGTVTLHYKGLLRGSDVTNGGVAATGHGLRCVYGQGSVQGLLRLSNFQEATSSQLHCSEKLVENPCAATTAGRRERRARGGGRQLWLGGRACRRCWRRASRPLEG